MNQTNKRDAAHIHRVDKLAKMTGLKKDTVRKIIRDVRKNEVVTSLYMTLLERDKNLQEMDNALLDEVKRIVPFD